MGCSILFVWRAFLSVRALPHTLFTTLALVFTSLTVHATSVSQGSLDHYAKFQSRYVASRDVQVWLPNNYSDQKRYAVLYMHDGQMLFDAATTWNKQEWMVDEVAQKLQSNAKTIPFIVVGIFNGGDDLRYIEYLPNKPYLRLTLPEKAKLFAPLTDEPPNDLETLVQSDNYLRFIVEELKPFIDGQYAVHTDKQHTFIMGSSMGGLISWYAMSEYPEIFGGAAAISSHWVGGSASQTNPVTAQFMLYMQNDFPAPGSHKIYFDYGDQTLDAYYPQLQAQVDQIMQARGYSQDDWLTLFDKGADHSEASWQKRLDKPLLFLLGSP